MFWLVLIPFLLMSALLTMVVLLQEPKQSGLGGGLDGGGGGGVDFGTRGGTAGGLQRVTIYLGIAWATFALLLQLVPR
jgi:protein translocase SecG subunit